MTHYTTHPGVALQPRTDIDTILWNMLGPMYLDMTWFNAIGCMFQAVIVTSIVSITIRYFDHWSTRDSTWLLYAVALGALISVATLGMTTAQQYFLVHSGVTTIHDYFRRLYLLDMAHMLIGAILNLAAATYYSYRAWRMTKCRWWVVPLFALALAAQFIVALVAVHHGFQLPRLTLDNLSHFHEFTYGNAQLFNLWGALNLAVDGSLCLIMTTVLIKTKQSVFHNESRLFTKILAAVYETMLPPALSLLILEILSSRAVDPLTDFRRPIVMCLPVLYWHSTVLTLAGRQKVRALLVRRLAEGGIDVYPSVVSPMTPSSGASGKTPGSAGSASHPSSPLKSGNNGPRVFVGRVREQLVGIELGIELVKPTGSPHQHSSLACPADATTSLPMTRDARTSVDRVPALTLEDPARGENHKSSWEDPSDTPIPWGSTDNLYRPMPMAA
ncbi:hypothetical protein IAU60_003634 [Kwoniella sp. DSM 27419]